MSKRTASIAFGATAAVLALTTSHAQAHHSFAMFDTTKSATYSGVVKEIQWANPHVWVIMVVNQGGKTDTYNFEAGAVAVLKRAGWTRDSVKAGDKLTVFTHPYRDGRPGGSLERATLPNGKTVGAGDAIPGALVVPGVQ